MNSSVGQTCTVLPIIPSWQGDKQRLRSHAPFHARPLTSLRFPCVLDRSVHRRAQTISSLAFRISSQLMESKKRVPSPLAQSSFLGSIISRLSRSRMFLAT